MTDRNALLETALHSLPDGFAVFGSGGNLVFWNTAASKITGYREDEIEADGLPRDLRLHTHEISSAHNGGNCVSRVPCDNNDDLSAGEEVICTPS